MKPIIILPLHPSDRLRAVKEPSPGTPKPKRRHRFLPGAIGTTGGVALAAVAFWFFKKQAEHVVEGKAERYDDLLMDAVHRIDDPTITRALHAVTQLGSHAAIG